MSLSTHSHIDSLAESFSISKESLNALPLTKYEGPIHLVSKLSDLKKAVKALSKELVLGFDTESRPSFKKGHQYPPSLLQLAASKEVYLFSLSQNDFLKHLSVLLEDANILKVGVAIKDDIKNLQNLHLFNPQSMIEISHLSKKLNIKYTGLRNLAGIFLNIRISKNAQTSNWAKPNLSDIQITYAATDAWVSREIYLSMQKYLD